jgi:hypothetical protein
VIEEDDVAERELEGGGKKGEVAGQKDGRKRGVVASKALNDDGEHCLSRVIGH